MESIQILDAKNMLAKRYKIGALGRKTNDQVGKIAFLQLRDGTAYFQGYRGKTEVGEGSFQLAIKFKSETAVLVTGEIREDSRSKFGCRSRHQRH